jgi:hypothetical protein
MLSGGWSEPEQARPTREQLLLRLQERTQRSHTRHSHVKHSVIEAPRSAEQVASDKVLFRWELMKFGLWLWTQVREKLRGASLPDQFAVLCAFDVARDPVLSHPDLRIVRLEVILFVLEGRCYFVASDSSEGVRQDIVGGRFLEDGSEVPRIPFILAPGNFIGSMPGAGQHTKSYEIKHENLAEVARLEFINAFEYPDGVPAHLVRNKRPWNDEKPSEAVRSPPVLEYLHLAAE